MSKYYHTKNAAAARGDPNSNSRATVTTPYSKKHGLYRQKQVDGEIERIRAYKKPSSSSKITITIGPTNLLTMHHHHHHCLDVQLTSRSGKGRVVWFWEGWETATDERVMKGVISALDSSWSESDVHDADATKGGVANSVEKKGASKSPATIKRFLGNADDQPSAGEKRKRAASAAESRMRNENGTSSSAEIIDLVGENSD